MWETQFKEAGTRLNKLRTDQGLSVYKLEGLSHIGYDTLLKIERGERCMTVRNAMKLAPILDSTPTFLLFGV